MLVNGVDPRSSDYEEVLEQCLAQAEHYERCARIVNSASAALYLRRILECAREGGCSPQQFVVEFYYFLRLTRIGVVLGELERIRLNPR